MSNPYPYSTGDKVQPTDPEAMLAICPTYSVTNTTHGIVAATDSDYWESVGVQWVTGGSVNPIVYWFNPKDLMSYTVQTADMWLVYRDSKGHKHYQSWREIVDAGSLVDPDTDDDMDVIGWTTTPDN
jgi:hypothetical protein